MVFEESHSIRSFVGRIDPGDDIIEALTLLCDANDIGAAEVRVAGTISDVEVVRFDDTSKQYVPIVDHAGPFEVVQFSGNMTRLGDEPILRAEALLAAQAPAGQQLVFGQIRRANAVDCEFVIQSFEDLRMQRKLDPATGRFPIKSIERTAEKPAPVVSEKPAAAAPPRERKAPETVAQPAGTARRKEPAADTEPEKKEEESQVSWSDAVEASAEMKPASQRERAPVSKSGGEEKEPEEVYGEYDFEEAILEAGDILDHPKLGECRVIKVEDDVYAHIRLSRGQIRKLALEVVELHLQEQRDGKNVFKVRVRK